VKVPIACSLSAEASEDRIREWRAFLSRSVVSADRQGNVLRLGLVLSDRVLAAAVDLAGREKACCPFFAFAIEIEPDARTLRVEVPAEAVAVLDDFAGLVGCRESGSD
jgi:hypothetical protein